MHHLLIIIGNVGRDPEMRYTPSGQAVTSFSVATNRQYKDRDGNTVKKANWFRVTTWGKTAEVCNQYVKKGSKIYIEGTLDADESTGGPRTWLKQDGTAGALFEVTAQTVRFLSSSQSGEGGLLSGANELDANIEEIPFK